MWLCWLYVVGKECIHRAVSLITDIVDSLGVCVCVCYSMWLCWLYVVGKECIRRAVSVITDIVDSLGVDGVSRSKQLCYASLSEYIESASQLLTVYMQHPGESVLHILSLWWQCQSTVACLHAASRWVSITHIVILVVACISGNGVAHVNKVTVCWAWLLLGYYYGHPSCLDSIPGEGHLSRYVPATQVNSAWPSLVDRHDEYQPKGGDALQLWFVCGWQVKLWSPCYTRVISERFRDKGLIIKCCI